MSAFGAMRLALRSIALAVVTIVLLPLLITGRILSGLGVRRSGAFLSHAAIGGWAKTSLAVMGVRVNRQGAPPEPPFFLVCNHLSYLDILVLHASCRGRFLSKQEIAHWPIAGWLARLAGTLFIDRSKRRDVSRAIPALQDALASGDGVMIFPEGTSSPGSAVLPFHASLLQVPISLAMEAHWASLAYRTPTGSQPAFLSVCWWGDMPFTSHFLKLLALPHIEADLRFRSETVQAPDRKTLAGSLQAKLQEHFQPTAPPEVEWPIKNATQAAQK